MGIAKNVSYSDIVNIMRGYNFAAESIKLIGSFTRHDCPEGLTAVDRKSFEIEEYVLCLPFDEGMPEFIKYGECEDGYREYPVDFLAESTNFCVDLGQQRLIGADEL